MRRISWIIGATLCALLVVPGPAAADQAEADLSNLCTLVTLDEASAATGLSLGTTPLADSAWCKYVTNDLDGLTMNMVTGVGSMDQRLASSPNAEQVDVAGYPGILTQDAAEGTSSVYVYPDPAVELWLELIMPPEVDGREILLGLAEQAVTRLVAAGLPAQPTPVPVPSVDATAGLCALLSLTDVADAVGKPLSAFLATPTSCAFADDPNGATPTGVILGLQRDSVGELEANVRDNLGDERDIEVAGIPALLSGPLPYQTLMRSDIYLFPDANTGVFVAVAGPEDVDTSAAALSLAELVASRLDRLPPP